jgi:uncharacterized integral membrane protein
MPSTNRERLSTVTTKRFISWVVGIPVAILLISFAVANRQWITVSLDPISRETPWLSVSMPAFLLLFIGIFLGLVVGGMVTWWRQGKWRKQARKAQVAGVVNSPYTPSSPASPVQQPGTGLTRISGPAA